MKAGTRIGFRWPMAEDEDWTPEAIANLVGQEVTMKVLDVPVGKVRVVEASRAHVSMGHALWVLIETLGDVEVSPPRGLGFIPGEYFALFDLTEGHGRPEDFSLG